MKGIGDFTADLVTRYPILSDSTDAIAQLGELMLATAKAGGTIFCCGNGGSAADADHIAGELMKGFLLPRPLTGKLRSLVASAGVTSELASDPPKSRTNTLAARLAAGLQSPIRALSLCSNQALLTAIMNDQGQDMVFAQQVLGLCKPGDLLICLSTSGRSGNVVAAAALASTLGVKVGALTGKGTGPLSEYCDAEIQVPGTDAGQIQDLHRPIYHALCAYVESSLFGQV
ncbi:MAG: SIS domain-containing protein [Clostridia bacterium]